MSRDELRLRRRRRLAILGVSLPGSPTACCTPPPPALCSALLLVFLGLLAAIGIAVDGDDLGVVDEAVDEGDDAGGVGEGFAPLSEGAVSPSLTRHFEDRLLSMLYREKISRRALHSGFFRPLRGQTIVFLMPPGAGSIPSAR